MEALASPICAQAIIPPLRTTCGRTPNIFGSQSTRSASLPGSTEPTSPSMPWATAGQIVYLATYRRARRLSAAPSPASDPRRCFITCAVCQVRSTTSPTRPIAWASEPIIEIAPRSCSRSSAAIVVGRIRLSAKARSSGTRAVQVVADHEHVEVLVEGVHGVRPGRVRAAGQHVRVPGDGDDVRRVTASGTLRVVRVDAPAGDRGQGVLDEAGLVEGVAVQRHGDPVLPGHRQRGVDRRRGRAPVLVQLEAARAGPQLLDQGRPAAPCCPCPAARR